MITKEDKDIITDSIYLDLLIQTLNIDRQSIEDSRVKIKEPYLALIDRYIKKLLLDKQENTKLMRKKGLKIVKKTEEDMMIQYDYLVRGYTGIMRFWKAGMRLQAKKRLHLLFENEEENNE